MLTKGKKEMKYDKEDTVEAKPVDYSKQINLNTLLEPISTSQETSTTPDKKKEE
jgi:hypothetical protein